MRGRKSNRRVQEMLILKEMLLGLPRKRIELRSTGQPRAAVPTKIFLHKLPTGVWKEGTSGPDCHLKAEG